MSRGGHVSAMNKAFVCALHQQVIERCDRDAFEALVAETFVNHSAAAGQPTGRE